MAAKAIAEAGEADSVMVICGWEHMHALGERFQNVGHTAEMIDLRNQPWYSDDDWNERIPWVR
jgi:hypothetical protein